MCAVESLIQRTCYACGNNQFDIVMAGNYSFFLVNSLPVPFRAVRCRRCTFVMTDPAPTASYEENQITEDSDRLIVSGRYRLRRLRSYLTPVTSILDIGCSTGFSVEEASKYGVRESVGIELCHASSEAGRRLGRDIRSKPLNECGFRDEQFHIVQAHHTLEHIQNLHEILDEIHRITKKDGIFYITQPRWNSPFVRTPNWSGWFPQEHYWHFSEKTLVSLLDNHGFDLLNYNCPMHTEYATEKGLAYSVKRTMKLLVKHLKLGDMIDSLFVKR